MTPTEQPMNHRIYYRKPPPMTPEERAEAREPRMTNEEAREIVARALKRGTLKPSEAKSTDAKPQN